MNLYNYSLPLKACFVAALAVVAASAIGKAAPPITSATVRYGLVYVNGKPIIGDGWNASTLASIAVAPGPLVRWGNGNFLNAALAEQQGKPVDLLQTEPAIAALEKAGKYAVIMIEPYWGTPVPAWSQVSWQGHLRGDQGLNTNACWRNPQFIADRLKKVRDIVSLVKRTPRAHARILGYIVWNENRWAMGEETCYCPYCRKAWPIWLKRQYGTIARLNVEYAGGYRSFEEVPLPAPLTENMFPETGLESMKLAQFAPRRNVSHEKAWRDFHLFKADGLLQFEKWGAAAAKQTDPTRLVITSLFTRGDNPLIGHVLLRLYRGIAADPNIDIMGGNMYEVFPAARAARHVAMWRSVERETPPARRKPVWFTEFNDIGGDWNKPYSTTVLNAALAHTTFSGTSGRLWFTDRDSSRLGVLEPDGSRGGRYDAIAAATQLAAAHTELIEQATRSDLPRQVAIINLDSWNALADNDHYNGASLAALDAFTGWAGFATDYVAEPELERGALNLFQAAVLWQAQRRADVSDAVLQKLKSYVVAGGTLIADPPLLQNSEGKGPGGGWEKFFGASFSNQRARATIALSNRTLGSFNFHSAPDAVTRNLGRWDVALAPGASAINDSSGTPAVVINRVGKGRVITFCFRIAFTEARPEQQIQRAHLFSGLLKSIGLRPLVDCPGLEKTIAPQDHGLLVTFFNPGDQTASSPLSFLQSPRSLSTIRVPAGAKLTASSVILPAGEWAVATTNLQ